MSGNTEAFDYQPSAKTSRSDRDASLTALQAVEEALAGPAPGRTAKWLDRVNAALDDLERDLTAQSDTDDERTSLLSEIAANQPRLRTRIDRLRQEYHDIRISLRSLRNQIGQEDASEIDVADIRDRLSSIGRRYRQHRSREADLVYEAVNIDLGLGG